MWISRRREPFSSPNSPSDSSHSNSGSDSEKSSLPSSGYDSSEEESTREFRQPDGLRSMLPHAARRLPAARRIPEIRRAVARSRVVCVLGDTGCGKSTVIPYVLANESGQNSSVRILCTQPRRMAAISLCEHVQTRFYGKRNHSSVGFRVRGQRTDTEESSLVYVTAGYLKTMLTHDPDELSRFTHLILDEVHERCIDSDFLSLIVKRLLAQPENASVKLVVMSATLESNLFVDYFSSLNSGSRPLTVNLTGRPGGQKKIEEFFLENLNPGEFPLADSCVRFFNQQAMLTLPVHGVLPGDLTDSAEQLAVELAVSVARDHFSTLVFLPGLGEIFSIHEKLVDLLEKRGEVVVPVDSLLVGKGGDELAAAPPALPATGHYYHIFVLHSTMPYEEQKLALKEPALNARHIVLSTNVAESSLTVPNVDVVIDSGLRRVNCYDPVNRVYRLTTVWCSKASCMQRRGRTGRVCNGRYLQLFTSQFYRERMASYDTPEVLLSDLSCVFLNAKYISEFWRLPDAGSRVVRPSDILRELITSPQQRNVHAAVVELFQAGILRHEPDEMSELSLLGTLATRLHVEPQVARILYFAWLMGMTCEGIVLAAASGVDTEIIRATGTKYQPGNEEAYCRSIASHMWYRTGYDLGSFSEPITLRNLVWSWMCHHYGVAGAGAPQFHRQAVYVKEFDGLKRSIVHICVQFTAWLQEEIGDEQAQGEADMLKELLSEKRAGSGIAEGIDKAEMIGTIFKAGLFMERLKSLLVVAMGTRLLTADAVGSGFDEAATLRFDKTSDSVFAGCHSESDRFARMGDVALKLTGRKPRNLITSEMGNIDGNSGVTAGSSSNWVVIPGADVPSLTTAAEIRKEDPDEYLRIKDDVHMTLGPSHEFAGLVMPVAVRTLVQMFDRRYVTTISVDGHEPGGDSFRIRARVKLPRYTNSLVWGRIDHVPSGSNHDDNIGATLSAYLSQWLALSVNAKSPVGWLHKVPLELRESSTDRYWAVAGNIVGSSKSGTAGGDDLVITDARAYNVTVLPVAKGGRVAAAMLLASLPFQHGLIAQIAMSDSGQYEVLRVKIQGRYFELNRCEKFPLTVKMLKAISAVRRNIAKALDIPGTCIRRRLGAEPAEAEGGSIKLAITGEAMDKVREIQGVGGSEKVNGGLSLWDAMEHMLHSVYTESATSQELFPAEDGSPTERRVMLIPDSGRSYGEITLDPKIWTDPDSADFPKSKRQTTFRRDQIAEIQKVWVRKASDPSTETLPALVSEKDNLEAPIGRLAVLGFSVNEISRYFDRKHKYELTRKPIDQIMSDDLDEDSLVPVPQTSRDDKLWSAFEEFEEFDTPVPARKAPTLGDASGEEEEERNGGDDEEKEDYGMKQVQEEGNDWEHAEKEEARTSWDHVSWNQPNVKKSLHVEIEEEYETYAPVEEIRYVKSVDPVRETSRTSTPRPVNQLLQHLWDEICSESQAPSVDLSSTPQNRLTNMWMHIQTISERT